MSRHELLTTEALCGLKGLLELRPHLYDKALALLKVFLSQITGIIDHLLYTIRVKGIQDITEPLLVNVNPISLVR